MPLQLQGMIIGGGVSGMTFTRPTVPNGVWTYPYNPTYPPSPVLWKTPPSYTGLTFCFRWALARVKYQIVAGSIVWTVITGQNLRTYDPIETQALDSLGKPTGFWINFHDSYPAPSTNAWTFANHLAFKSGDTRNLWTDIFTIDPSVVSYSQALFKFVGSNANAGLVADAIYEVWVMAWKQH